MKKVIYLLLLVSTTLFSQENYKTVVIPTKFDFQSEANQYGLNELCKMFFEKEGFQVVVETEVMTDELFKNRCEYLYLDLEKDKGFLNTKMTVVLKDCKKAVILKGTQAITKEKSFDKAHSEITRETLISLRGKLNIAKPNSIENQQESRVEVPSSKKLEVKNELEKTEEDVKSISTKSEPTFSAGKIVTSQITKNGYNLVDENKNVKFELLKTSNPTIFIAKKGNFQGIFTLNGQNSKFESYPNKELVVEEVEVKF